MEAVESRWAGTRATGSPSNAAVVGRRFPGGSLKFIERSLARIPFAGRFALLFFFLLGSIVVYPYAETSGTGYYAFRVLWSVIILLTIWALTFSRGLLVLVLALAIPAVVQHIFLHPQTTGALPLLSRVLSSGFDFVVIVIISRHVFSTKEPSSETIFAALCVYLLMGFLFAGIYSAIGIQVRNAFLLDPTVNLHSVPDRFDFLYLSFGTLTELGAPGITAVAPIARSVILLQAILGILYVAVLISRLISGYRSAQGASTAHETEPEQGLQAGDQKNRSGAGVRR